MDRISLNITPERMKSYRRLAKGWFEDDYKSTWSDLKVVKGLLEAGVDLMYDMGGSGAFRIDLEEE